MARPAVTVLVLVTAGIVAAEVLNREARAAGQREPFVGIAELARRLQARRGRFSSAVTGIDPRQPFDPGSFGGWFGSPPPAAPAASFTSTIEDAVEVRSVGMGDDPTVPDFGIPNTAPQDFTIAQFAAAKVSETSPAVRALTAVFGANPGKALGAAIDALAEALGITPSPATTGTVAAGAKGAAVGRGLATAGLAAAAGQPGAAIGAALGATASLISSGGKTFGAAVAAAISQALAAAGRALPSGGPLPSLVTELSLALGKLGVTIEAGRRAKADPTFNVRVAAEVARQQQDPARFFAVLQNPRAFPDAPQAPIAEPPAVPEFTFSTPRVSGPDPDAAPPSSPSPGEGAPAGPPGDAPASTGDAPTGSGAIGAISGDGGLAGLGAPVGLSGEPVGFSTDVSLSPAPPSAPPADPSEGDDSGGDGGDGGDGGVGGGDGAPGGAGTGDAGGVSGP